MAEYHKFVFDEKNRKFVGAFEEMYQAEVAAGFDSWHQEDTRDLSKQIALKLLGQFSFQSVLDLGCGKGAWIHQLKTRNNRVLALDVSETAIKQAQARFPDIRFKVFDLKNQFLKDLMDGPVDLATCLETLSYLDNWEKVIDDVAAVARHMMVALYIPENPMGFVKNEEDLVRVFSRHFEIIHDIRLRSMRKIILLGRSSRFKEAA